MSASSARVDLSEFEAWLKMAQDEFGFYTIVRPGPFSGAEWAGGAYPRWLAKFAPGHRPEDITGIYVTDFYNLERIDARKAYFVTGSDVLGPMGHEFVPLASKADADDFLKDHKGKKLYTFERITPALANGLDNGRFD